MWLTQKTNKQTKKNINNEKNGTTKIDLKPIVRNKALHYNNKYSLR